MQLITEIIHSEKYDRLIDEVALLINAMYLSMYFQNLLRYKLGTFLMRYFKACHPNLNPI